MRNGIRGLEFFCYFFVWLLKWHVSPIIFCVICFFVLMSDDFSQWCHVLRWSSVKSSYDKNTHEGVKTRGQNKKEHVMSERFLDRQQERTKWQPWTPNEERQRQLSISRFPFPFAKNQNGNSKKKNTMLGVFAMENQYWATWSLKHNHVTKRWSSCLAREVPHSWGYFCFTSQEITDPSLRDIKVEVYVRDFVCRCCCCLKWCRRYLGLWSRCLRPFGWLVFLSSVIYFSSFVHR